MSNIFESLSSNPQLLIPIVAIVGGISVAIIAIIFGVINTIATNAEHEKSRREIAAYVAEGSITPEDAEKLLASSKKNKSCCG